ncbi:MAG: GAF domain-containing protein [Anaerolineales bacterium]|nr:GAF domain-containing protein [Anaerolineales bacterium]
MNLPFLQKQDPEEQPSALLADTVQSVRERILNTMTVGAAIAGILVYFLVVVRPSEDTPTALPALIVYTIVVSWMLVVALFRRLGYQARALSLAGMLFVLSVTSYLQAGVTADGAIFMLGFVFITGLLLGPRTAVLAIILGTVITVAIAIVMSQNILVPAQIFVYDNLSAWTNRIAVFLLLAVVIAISLSAMLRGLESSLTKAMTFAAELEKDQEELRQHSDDLEKRSLQIRTAAEISRSISGVLDPETLLQEVVNLIQARFTLYYAGVFLVDEQQRYAVLRAATGETGEQMISAGHKLPIGESSMIGWTILNRKARIALDVGQDAVRFANPYLPDTRSELALPLVSGDRVLGALTIQSSLPVAFDQDDITILQNIADTLAIALENARLFAELESNLDEIRHLHGQYLRSAWSQRANLEEQAEFAFGATRGESDKLTAIDFPLTLREQIIGQLTLEGSGDWSAEERGLIESVATQAALALENARLLEESQQTALRERLVSEIATKIWSSPNTDAILQSAVKELGRALRADEALIELKLD